MFEIGVDIGGTNIKYGLVNEALEIVARGSIPFPKTTAEDMADKLAAALRAMLAEQGVTEIGSIGIVVPGSIDKSGEIVIAAYNLGFHDVPLRAIMQARFPGVPVYIANDANGAALAELYKGAFVGCKTAVLFTLGTGFGGGIVRDLLLGAQDVYFMSHPDLIWVSLAICLLTFYFRGIFLDLNKSILLADTLSVALFALAGSSKAFAHGLDPLYVVIMGVITAVGGGALRDSFAGIMPAIFRGSNYYAMACLGGSCVFALLAFAGVNLVLAGFACVFAVLMLRYLSIRFNWRTREEADLTPRVASAARTMRQRLRTRSRARRRR